MAENIPTVQETFAALEERGISVFSPDRVTRWCFENCKWIILAPLAVLLFFSVFFPDHAFLDFQETNQAIKMLDTAQSMYKQVQSECNQNNSVHTFCDDISKDTLFEHTNRAYSNEYRRIEGYRIDTLEGINWYVPALELIDTAWYVSSVLLVLILSQLFRYVLKRIIRDFTLLANTGRLLPDLDYSDSPWRYFTAQLERSIHSRWRWVFITIGLGIVGVYINKWVSDQSWSPGINNPINTIQVFVMIMLTPALFVFLASVMVWVLWVAGIAIRELTPAFKFDILPEHPDDSGGLACIGDMAFAMVLPFTTGVIFLSFWFALGFLSGILLAGLVLLLLIGTIVFFWSLWDVHQVMITEKKQYQDDLAEQIRETEDELLKILDRTGSEDDYDERVAKRLQDLLDTLRSRKDVARTYPTWPFSRKLVVRIFSQNTVPPLIGLLLNLTLAGSWAEILNALTK